MSLKLNFSLFLLFLLSGIQQSCSDTSLTSGKSAEGSDRVRIADEGMTDSGDGLSESQNSDQADSTGDDEKIVAMEPSVISGSYLVCMESSENLVDVWCGLRKGNQKVTIQNLEFYFDARSEGGEVKKVPFHEIDHPFWTYKIKDIESVYMKESVRLVVLSEDSLFTVSQNGSDQISGLPALPDEHEESKVIDPVVRETQAGDQVSSTENDAENNKSSDTGSGNLKDAELSHDRLPENDDDGVRLKQSEDGLGKEFNFDVDLLMYQENGKSSEDHFHGYDLENQLNGVDLMDIGTPGKKQLLSSLISSDEKFYIISVNANEENSPYMQINDRLFKAHKLSADTSYPHGRPLFKLGDVSGGIKVTTLQFAFENDDLDENDLLIKRKAGDVSTDKLNKNGQYRDGAFVLQFVKDTGAPLMIDALTGRVLEHVLFEVYLYRH